MHSRRALGPIGFAIVRWQAAWSAGIVERATCGGLALRAAFGVVFSERTWMCLSCERHEGPAWRAVS